MIGSPRTAIAVAALSLLTALAAAAQDLEQVTPADRVAQMDRILDAQLKAVSDLLPPDLQQSFTVSQQTWLAHRDQQCAFELQFGREDGRARIQEDNGRDVACITRFNRQRLTELQHHLTTLMEFAGKPPKAAAKDPSQKCRIAGLPRKFEVHAIGTYAGLTLAGVKLDDSIKDVRNAKVVVNRPGIPVVLVLMAHDPVVWQISHTPGTTIAGVVVGSHYRQAVLGVPRATPVQLNTREDNDYCGSFYAYDAGSDLATANGHVKLITGRAIDQLVTKPAGNRFIVGAADGIDEAALASSPERSIGDYGAIVVGIGKDGVIALAAQGKVRQATQADIDAWVAERSEAGKLAKHRMRPSHTFVILESFDMPAGLTERSGPYFILPEGAPMPTGPIKHVWFYRMDSDGACQIGPIRAPCPE
jgi:hypothetical protein